MDKANKDIKILEDKATAGDADAQYELGSMYHDEYNHKEAFEWYIKSATQGHVLAENIVGFMCYYEIGTTQSFDKAFYWFTKSANQGNAEAQYMLGYMYHNAKGIEQDYKKALEWYDKSAAQEYEYAKIQITKIKKILKET